MAAHNMHTEEYVEDYEEEDRLLHHSSWKKKSPSIDRNGSTSIDTKLHQPSHLRASTDIAYYPSIDTNVDATRDKDYSIGSWADDRHHESYAVEIAYHDELHEGFTYEELLNMQRRDDTYQKRAEAAWERTHFSHPIDRAIPPSIDINPSTLIDINHTTSIDIRPKPKTTVSEIDKFDNQYLTLDEFGIFKDPNGYARAVDGRTLHVSREDIADILQTANGADNLFVQQHNFPDHQQKVTKNFCDTAGGIDKSFKQRSRHPTRPSIDVDVSTSANIRPEFGRSAFDLSVLGSFIGKRRMSMKSTEMIRDTPETLMDTPFAFTTKISEDLWIEFQEMSTPTYVFQNMLAHSHKLR
ncbi:unnamed protein product [Brassica rapa]|nr:unnamed protein product [Brassica rapa]